MNYVMLNVASLVLASSISYSNLSGGAQTQRLQPPPPAPPVAAETSGEEETFTGVSADGDQSCLDCLR